MDSRRSQQFEPSKLLRTEFYDCPSIIRSTITLPISSLFNSTLGSLQFQMRVVGRAEKLSGRAVSSIMNEIRKRKAFNPHDNLKSGWEASRFSSLHLATKAASLEKTFPSTSRGLSTVTLLLFLAVSPICSFNVHFTSKLFSFNRKLRHFSSHVFKNWMFHSLLFAFFPLGFYMKFS